MGCAAEIAVGMRLGVGEVFAGENGVEKRVELGMLGVDAFHFLVIAAGDYARGDVVATEVGEEVEDACDIGRSHLALEVVETACDGWALCFQRAREVGIVDLSECLSLDGVLEAWALGVVEAELRAPEAGVLGLGIKDDTVEVKESG